MKEFFEKAHFEKSQQTTIKCEKLPNMQIVNIIYHLLFTADTDRTSAESISTSGRGCPDVSKCSPVPS